MWTAFCPLLARRGSGSLTDYHHGRPDDTTVKGVAFLHHRDHRIGLDVRVLLNRHRLMHGWVKRLTQWDHRFDVEFDEAVRKTLKRKIYALMDRLDRIIVVIRSGTQGPLKVVHYVQQFNTEFFQTELVRFFHVLLGSAAEILHFCLHPKQIITRLPGCTFSLFKLRQSIRQFLTGGRLRLRRLLGLFLLLLNFEWNLFARLVMRLITHACQYLKLTITLAKTITYITQGE